MANVLRIVEKFKSARSLICCFALGLTALHGPSRAADLAVNDSGFPAGFKTALVDEPVFGGRIHVVEGGDPRRPLVLLIHGLGNKAALDWSPLMPGLARRYHVLAFDLPGFGRSDRPDASYTPERYAELAHWLVRRYASDGRANIVGHSLGGAVALYYTYRYQSDVDRLLMIDTAGLLHSSVFLRHLSLVSAPKAQSKPEQFVLKGMVKMTNSVTGGLIELLDKGSDSREALLRNDSVRSLLVNDQSMINAGLGLMALDFTPLLGKVETPVWMLWGEADPVAPLRSGRALHALLPRSGLTVLKEVGHVPMNEAADATLAWALSALEQSSPAPEGKRVLAPSTRDGKCVRERGARFSGAWRRLELDGCKNAVIENARIEQLVVRNSDVALHDTEIVSSNGFAIHAERSAITATGLRIKAASVLKGRKTRFDLAAAVVDAPSWGTWSGSLRLAASLSRWCDGNRLWRLHDLWRLSDKALDLDKALRTTDDGACSSTAPSSTGPS